MRSADESRRDGSNGIRHVLMTADAVGGVWTYALDLARELGASTVRVSLAVLGPPPSPEQHAACAAISGLDLYEHHGRLEWMADPWHDVAAAGTWLLDLERRLRPDLVHLNGYAHGALPWRSPVMVAGHSCVLSWWAAVHGEAAPASYAAYAERVACGLAAADMVVAPTAAMLEALQRHYGSLRRTRVIANGRSHHPGRVTRLTGGKQKLPMILSAGRIWDEAKNVAALCRVARTLSWPVFVAGELIDPSGGEPGAPSSLPGEVHYLGRLDEGKLAAWMSRAAIYALPARYEPFGLSALEAAQAGCALVLGDIPSLREVWGPAVVYVPPDDEAALQRALTALITDDEGRVALAGRSHVRASQLSAAGMAAAYFNTYREIVDEVRSLLPLGAV
jgi:glycosyltransferase involved in cell wall biosynthesis